MLKNSNNRVISKIQNFFIHLKINLKYLASFIFFIFILYFGYLFALLQKTQEEKVAPIQIQQVLNEEMQKTENLSKKLNSKDFSISTETSENTLIDTLNRIVIQNEKIKAIELMPNKLSLKGDYVELINCLQRITQEIPVTLQTLKMSSSDNDECFALNVSLQPIDVFNTQPETEKHFEHLTMGAYLAYGEQHWCILKEPSKSPYLLKEGDEVHSAEIKAIFPDHIILLYQQQEYRLSLKT